MKKFFTIIGYVSLTVSLFLVGFVVTSLIYDNGREDGMRQGTELGFAVGLKTAQTVYKAQQTAKDNLRKEVWQLEHFSDGRVFFQSEYASPPLFEMDIAFNYFYTEKYVYAFPVEEFSFTEIYELFLQLHMKPIRYFSDGMKSF